MNYFRLIFFPKFRPKKEFASNYFEEAGIPIRWMQYDSWFYKKGKDRVRKMRKFPQFDTIRKQMQKISDRKSNQTFSNLFKGRRR